MLPWQPLRIAVVVGYTFNLLSEAIFYLLRTFLTVAMVTKILQTLINCLRLFVVVYKHVNLFTNS